MSVHLRPLALAAALAAAPAASYAGCADEIDAWMGGPVYEAHRGAATEDAKRVFQREIAIARRFAATEKETVCREVFAGAKTVLADNRLADIIRGYGASQAGPMTNEAPAIDPAPQPAPQS
jgi:hypothetical protein